MTLFSLLLPEDLKREVLRFLHKRYFDVVLDELFLVTERLKDIPLSAENCDIAILLLYQAPRWAYIYRMGDRRGAVYNILKLRKGREGKMASVP